MQSNESLWEIEDFPAEAEKVHKFFTQLMSVLAEEELELSLLDVPSLLSISQPFNSPKEVTIHLHFE